ncbi:ABC transporter ATP-binding protein [Xaviernesmea oryzae]|uniref:ABC transporter ATP-binding protein n=1 Tax=Xaviernesmea oryzae TaxID=464029 RepID=A0A1Q9B153_9HYPH|nr:ABC transporter ATP-binding protein [Xaviernesmea oryzae]OLP61719.1 ABC transporter ATP-binding protein [Xaviernesmea oryzae]SEL07240.1 carbohydrate ABC transporter ATP-binding protein, CUT1 family (TC 3.A.1.1.-) [Xaviernesmea oryzae]
MSSLQISNAAKAYGAVPILDNINLDIASGEFVVFVGPSGCGKSTLLRMISGLEDITAGEMRLDDRVINHVDPAKRGIAMVFQSYALYPHLTVFENMAFSLTMARAPMAERKEKVERAAEILRLTHLLDRRPAQLSGGQKQRVAIGRAIVRQPKVFLFDEPLSNLDAELRVQMRAELIQLHQRLRATMIYVTHDQVEAMTLADKIVVLNGGRIQQVGRPLDLYDDPDNKFVAGFIGTPTMNFLSARVKDVAADHIVVSGLGGDTAAAGLVIPFAGFDPSIREIQLGIRPEHATIAIDPASAEGLAAKVTLVEELGDLTSVHTVLANGERLVAQNHGRRHSGAIETVVRIAADKALVFDMAGQRLRPAKA